MKKHTLICFILSNILLLVVYVFVLRATLLGAPIVFMLGWLIIYFLVNSVMSRFVVTYKKQYIRICIIVPLLIPVIWFFLDMLLYGY